MSGIIKNERKDDIWNTNERAIVFIKLHLHVLCTAFCHLSQHSYGSVAWKECILNLRAFPPAGLSCYLLSLTGWAWFQILSWYICPVVSLPSSGKQNKLNSQTWCRKEGPWFPVSRIAKLRGHYGWFFGEMMLIWEENKLGLERYTHKPVQLVRWWDQRHLVVVVDYLIIFYKLFTSYFNF